MTQIPGWAAEKARRKRPGRPWRYPFVEMQLYQVIQIPPSKLHVATFEEFEAYLKKANERGRMGSKKFVCRQIEDGTVEVCRVK